LQTLNSQSHHLICFGLGEVRMAQATKPNATKKGIIDIIGLSISNMPNTAQHSDKAIPNNIATIDLSGLSAILGRLAGRGL